MAVRTCEGSTAPEEQAAPVEQARPFRSSAMMRASPSMPGKVMLEVFGVRGALAALTRESGTRQSKAALEFVAQSWTCAARLSPERMRASSAALPRPTMPATFSVPGRKPRWWWPP